LRPLTYIGRISYGLYLYHWPLFLVINHGHTGLSGSALLAARLTATVCAAVLSFHLVEQPIRAGYLARGWRGLRTAVATTTATGAVVVAATIPSASGAVPIVSASSRGLPPSEHDALAAVRAFTTNPVRFLLVGDSLAVTASIGLSIGSRNQFGVDVIDGADLGCGLDLGPSRFGGVANRGGPSCEWRTRWNPLVAKYRPDVVGLLIGRFELADQLMRPSSGAPRTGPLAYFSRVRVRARGGHWVHVGQRQWDAHLELELDQAVAILASGGARVVLFTYPYIDPPVEQLNGSIYPENDPRRVDSLNAVFRRVAIAHPATVTLVDLNRVLDPQGHFTTTIDGTTVRWPNDGIHISAAGGTWLQPKILPQIAELGLQVRLIGQRR
jgi:hypothetical protein